MSTAGKVRPGRAYLERVGTGEDGDERHVDDRCDGAGDPHFEVTASEPVLLCPTGVDQEQPEAEFYVPREEP